MQDFFIYESGQEAKADVVLDKAAKKLVKDMHYEARVQVMIQFYAEHRGEKVNRKDARTINLTREQYMQVNIIH